ncbi:MAG: Iron-sulfur cluster assembly scaffold protein IscU [Calditrichaeota bacterium]|nr:Iron-sulfur cluster assembly scaffold protein IscU [Calditrichota bacterium]
MEPSATYLEHFQAPKNVGELEEPRAFSEVVHEGGGCFDRLRVTLRVADGVVEDAKWRARACSGTVAAASAASEWAIGKTVADVAAVTSATLIGALDGIPERKRHSVELAARALREAAADS